LVESNNIHRSIVRNIIDGSITIDSISEFESILKIFPNNPALQSVYADLLINNNLIDAAAKAYRKAATLYIDSGMMLSAVLVKILEWRIFKPSPQQARPFYSILRKAAFDETPLNIFLNSLSHSEMAAVTIRMARVRLPEGKMIKKTGGVDNSLYFIAAGIVKATTSKPQSNEQETSKDSAIYLSENDIFGDIFPLEEENVSQSDTETVTYVELGKITKPRLIEVCRKYPNVEQALIKLFYDNSKSLRKTSLQEDRKLDRQPLCTQMSLEIFRKGTDNLPLVFHGYSRDISVGGVGIVLNAEYQDIKYIDEILKNSRIDVCFPSDAFSIKVPGTFMWSRKISFEGEKTLAVGMQFKEMTPKFRGMLLIFVDMLSNNR
jgi:CRP-like cAMP-binding protein